MASSSLLPALWVHRVSSPPSLLPPPPLGALPPQPASTSTATSATTLVHARGLGLCHLTIGSSAPRPGHYEAGDGRSRQRSLNSVGVGPAAQVTSRAAGRPIFGESAAQTTAPAWPSRSATPSRQGAAGRPRTPSRNAAAPPSSDRDGDLR